MNHSITAQHAKALDLHNRIMVSAQLVQTNLWDMCNGLKEMRDGKLYKELGYQNFEEYCGTEFNMSAGNARRYISIIENIPAENRALMHGFGMTKLSLLSTLSEADQQKITAANDVSDMTVKELEAEIKKLKGINDKLNIDKEHLEEDLDDRDHEIRKIKGTLKDIDDQNIELRNEIKELRSRPIDVTAAEPSDDVRQLKETIKNLERTSEKQVDQLQEEHLRDIRQLHEKNRIETQKQLDAQKAEYEEKLRQAAQPAQQDDKQVFKAYYSAAYDAFYRMIAFAAQSPDHLEFFRGKISALISSFSNANRDM